jgi:dodecin
MTAHVYKLVDLVGTSPESVTDAIQTAIARASATIRNIRWFEVVQVRGDVADGKVGHYQVTLRVGFTLEAEVASAEVAEIPAAAGV